MQGVCLPAKCFHNVTITIQTINKHTGDEIVIFGLSVIKSICYLKKMRSQQLLDNDLLDISIVLSF